MNKKVLIAIVVAVAVIAVGAIGFTVVKGVIIKSNPVNYLLYSTTQNNYEAVDMSFSGTFNIEEESLSSMLSLYSADPEAMAKFVSSMLDNVSMDGSVKWMMDNKDKTFYLSEKASFNYADQSLFSFGGSLSNDQLRIGSETLMDKSFVMTKDELFDLIKQEGDIDLSQINYDKYIDLLDMEKDPLYKAFVKDIENYIDIARVALDPMVKGEDKEVTLSDGKTIKCDVLELSISYEDMLRTYIDLMTEAKSDVELKALVKGKMIEALNLMITSEDYLLLQIESEEITAAIQELETNFDATWISSIDELIYVYQDMQYQTASLVTEPMSYSFAIDSKYNLRQVVTSVNTMGIGVYQTMTYNAYGKDVKMDEVSESDETISIMEMVNDPEYATTVGTELVDQGLTNIIEGEALSLLMADLEEKSSVLPADEQQVIVDLVKYFFDNKEMLKDTIIDGMGI